MPTTSPCTYEDVLTSDFLQSVKVQRAGERVTFEADTKAPIRFKLHCRDEKNLLRDGVQHRTYGDSSREPSSYMFVAVQQHSLLTHIVLLDKWLRGMLQELGLLDDASYWPLCRQRSCDGPPIIRVKPNSKTAVSLVGRDGEVTKGDNGDLKSVGPNTQCLISVEMSPVWKFDLRGKGQDQPDRRLCGVTLIASRVAILTCEELPPAPILARVNIRSSSTRPSSNAVPSKPEEDDDEEFMIGDIGTFGCS